MSTNQKLLLELLAREDHPDVKLLDDSYRKVPAKYASLLVRKAPYEWCGSGHRVRKIRPLAPPPPIWQPCYRNTSSPALQPSVEWLNSRRSC